LGKDFLTKNRFHLSATSCLQMGGLNVDIPIVAEKWESLASSSLIACRFRSFENTSPFLSLFKRARVNVLVKMLVFSNSVAPTSLFVDRFEAAAMGRI
jgi:hypothetical protein